MFHTHRYIRTFFYLLWFIHPAPITYGQPKHTSNPETELEDIVTSFLPKEPVEVEIKSPNYVNEFFSRLYEDGQNYKANLKTLIVGLKEKSQLMTLEDIRRSGYLRKNELVSIYEHSKDLQPGQFSLVKLIDASMHRSGYDLIIGRYPESFVAAPYGQEAFTPSNMVLDPFMNWLELLGHLIWVEPVQSGAPAAANPTNSTNFKANLRSLATSLSINHYNDEDIRSLNGSVYATPTGLGTAASASNNEWSHGFWLSGMPGWAGIGYSGLFNMQESQLGLDAIGAGGFVAGWKDYSQLGLSIHAVSSSGNQGVLGAVLTISKNRSSTYKHPYQKKFDPLLEAMAQSFELQQDKLQLNLKVILALRHLYHNVERAAEKVQRIDHTIEEITAKLHDVKSKLADTRMEAKRLIHQHFIEIVDSQGGGLRTQGGAYLGGVGLGFRSSLDRGKKTVYRFYTNLGHTQELLAQGRSKKPAILRLGKQYETKDFPDILNPQNWEVGEEVITTHSRTFSGSIVLGIGQIPGVDAKIGLSESFNTSFDVGVRRLPDNKVEVTYRPSRTKELGAFLSSLNISGPQIAAVKTIVLAVRQTMIFDFNELKAREKYRGFFISGTLPHSFAPSTDIIGPREAEAMIKIARKTQRQLLEDGILLTYLEKVDIPIKKKYLGILRTPLITENWWAGFSYEKTKGRAKVISTNGRVALSRESELVKIETTNGLSGRHSTSTYATIKSGHILKEKEERERDGFSGVAPILTTDQDADQYTSAFQGLTLQAHITDSKITRNENNDILHHLNSLFNTNIQDFKDDHRGHHEAREVFIERTIFTKEIEAIQKITGTVLNTIACDVGIPVNDLREVKDRNDNFGATQVAEKIKELVRRHGIRAMAAIHRLADGSNRNLYVRTTASTYTNALDQAKQAVARYSSSYNDSQKESPEQSNLGRRILIDSKMSAHKIRKVVAHILRRIHSIDQAINQLECDPYFTHSQDILEYEKPDYREHRDPMISEFVAVRTQLCHLLDFDGQGMDRHEARLIEHKLSQKNLERIRALLAREENIHKQQTEDQESHPNIGSTASREDSSQEKGEEGQGQASPQNLL